jgi:hypothetical protein
LAKIARHTPALTGITKIRAMSLDVALLAHFGDAVTELSNESQWKEIGDTVDDIVDACKSSIESWYSDMLIGSVSPWLSTPPDGWLLLDGSTHAEVDYPELFAVLDDVLKSGSDFTLPDVTESYPFGVQVKPDAGIVTGSNTLNLTVGQLPAHTHTYLPPTMTIPVGPPPTTPVGGIGSATPTGSTGDGDNIDKRPSSFGLVFAVFAGRT